MRRRELIGFCAAAAVASPLVSHAEVPAALARIGYLRFGSAAASAKRVAALRAGLRDLGYAEGKNMVIEFRWAERFEQLTEFAGELAALKVCHRRCVLDRGRGCPAGDQNHPDRIRQPCRPG
jgi:putative ABC transport system substrate-binding protein